MTYRWIITDSDLVALVEQLLGQPRYALDTEFHRERTYFPKLALLQFADEHEIVLVDPLACDLSPLKRLFDSDVLAVLHAAQQDLDVLTHAVGSVPRRLYDTQLAAGFIGYSTPSLVSLLQAELKVTMGKGDRLTDWLRRPLSAEQCDYAASDVAHLFQLQEVIDTQLAADGRTEWAQAACAELLLKPVSGVDPSMAWTRLKDVRVLKAKARGVAQAVAEWRERRAMSLDSPVRQVLPDLAVLGISQKQPRTIADLAQARGVDDRHTRGTIGKELLAAVEKGLAAEASLPPADGEELERHLRPAVSLVSAWVSEVARKQRIDTTLLATRNDLVSFLRGDESSRLAHGWRNEFLGDGIRRLVEGRAALTFDGRGGLNLIDVAP
ncbi:MAG: HRDC domain-containing protein [Actinomycetota bacterium]|nr:HRDC domain-containing protein [Actinomycetota bacterium]